VRYYRLMKRLLIFLSVLLISCIAQQSDQGELTAIILTAGDQEIPLVVEIADEPLELERGLMGREFIPNDQGMLFIFPSPKILTFWMKDTLIPLDVLFFDADGNFINMKTMDPCTADPCQTYSSNGLATSALELASGFYEQQLEPLLQQKGAVLQLRFAEE